MKAAITFEATVREKATKGTPKRLRANGQIPAVLYSKGQEPVTFSLPENHLVREHNLGGLKSKLVEIVLDGKTYQAIPREIQLHPVSDGIEHIDFLGVDEKSRVKVQIPVHFKGRERCVGLRRGGVLNVVRHDLELICSPANIPSEVVINIKALNIGDSVHISHVTLPQGVEPAITDRDFTVATIAGRQKEEEVVKPEGEEAEGESMAEGGEAKEGEKKAEAKDGEKKAEEKK